MNPTIKGGQGRDADEVEQDGRVVGVVLIAALWFAFGWVSRALVGGAA